jgi:hypothetical protein
VSKPNPSGRGSLGAQASWLHLVCRPCPNNEVVDGREAPDAEVVATAKVMVTFKTCIGRARKRP